jgi:hypothetical protein
MRAVEKLTAFVELESASCLASQVGSPTPRPGRYIDHASHAHGAVRGTEVIIRASADKSDAVFRASVGENSLAAVYVIRGTKPPISHAINPACDTVAIAGPCPAHGVAHKDVDCWSRRSTRPRATPCEILPRFAEVTVGQGLAFVPNTRFGARFINTCRNRR